MGVLFQIVIKSHVRMYKLKSKRKTNASMSTEYPFKYLKTNKITLALWLK
jgi:hypothetical protein